MVLAPVNLANIGVVQEQSTILATIIFFEKFCLLFCTYKEVISCMLATCTCKFSSLNAKASHKLNTSIHIGRRIRSIQQLILLNHNWHSLCAESQVRSVSILTVQRSWKYIFQSDCLSKRKLINSNKNRRNEIIHYIIAMETPIDGPNAWGFEY